MQSANLPREATPRDLADMRESTWWPNHKFQMLVASMAEKEEIYIGGISMNFLITDFIYIF